MLTLTYDVKRLFFDRPAVQQSISRANARALSRVGAFLRRRARSRLRRRKRVSSPGESPSVHSTDTVATLKNILFAFEPRSQSVIAGPLELNQRNFSAVESGSVPVPAVMEFGGEQWIHEVRSKGAAEWRRRDMRRGLRPWQEARRRRASYQPRPFMGPALAEEVAAGTMPQSFFATIS